MEYEAAVASAPPGWRHFSERDIARLPAAVRARALSEVPRGERGERLVRALFWTFVYHLEPDMWDALARHEPIHPALIAALPQNVGLAVDVGAGSGRLTAHLLPRSRRIVAVEPSRPLLAMLRRRMPAVTSVMGWAEALPLRDGVSELTAACGAFGAEPRLVAELTRVTAHPGVIALVSPEDPAGFERLGWRRVSVPPQPGPPRPAWIDDFFGPPDPPHELVILRVG